MKNFFSIITFLIICIGFSYGQDINYYGKISDMDSKSSMSGVKVTVLSGNTTITSTTTSSNGDYSVDFAPGRNYTVKYSKSGIVTKIIKLNVSGVNAEDLPPGGKIFPPINIDLFAERPGVDFSFMETQPVVSWSFENGNMTYNKGQMQSMKSKIEAKLAESANQSKASDAEYNKLISEADALYNSNKYKEALNKYVAALQVPGKQKEAHPNSRLLEIEDLLQKQDEKELAYKQENQAYLNLIEAADNFASAKDYSKAIAKYEEAIAMKSDEQYPKDKVAELKEEVANAKKRAEYDKIVKRADGFLKQNSLKAARDAYQAALKIFPKEEYPAKQLADMQGKLDAQKAVEEQKDKYNAAIKEADILYNAENYEEAIVKYEEALTFESAATYPAGRIKMAQDIIDEKAAEAKKIEDFNTLVAEADAHVSATEFEDAVTKYTAAIALMEDPEVQTKLDNAKSLLAEQKKNEEQKEQINALMTSAQEKMGDEAYAKAIEDYSSVLALNDKFQAAIEGKKKAEELLAEKQSQEEKENQFNELVAAADKAFAAKTWQEAKTNYLAAQAIYDDKEHVNNRIIEVEAMIAQADVDEQITELLASATEKVNAEEYAKAIKDYDAVLALKADQAEAVEGKKNAEQLMADKASQQQQESAFEEVVAEADKAFDDKNWTVAKEKYTAAKAIFNDREHVNTRLDEVEAQIKKEAAQEENLAQIQTLLNEAEALKPENKWNDVISKYEAALAIDSEREDVSEMLVSAKESKTAWDAAQANAEKEEEFNSIVAEADKAYDSESWENAKDQYMSAKAIFDDNEHVNTRITEINTTLASLQSQEENLAQIQTLLDEAEALKPENKWSDVIIKYEAALAIDSEREDVSEMLAAAKESKTAWDAEQSKDAQFEELKTAGNELLAEEKWSDAKVKYELALEIQSDEEISVNLELIEENLALAAAAQSREEEYNAKMSSGEEFAANEDYQNAMNSFKEALEIKENDATATARVQDMKDKMEALALANSKSQQYDEAMKLGTSAMVQEDYAAAVKAFDDALIEIPGDAEATRLKEEAKSKIEELQAEEAEYNAFIEAAELKYEEAKAEDNDVLKLAEAKQIFESAQNVRPQASLPQNKIVEIDDLLRKIKEEASNNDAAIEQAYQDQLQLASVAANDSKFESAIEYLKEAQKIKPNETFPASEILKFQAIIDDAAAAKELETKYNTAIQKADLAFENKEYDNSIQMYNEALALKEEESYPKTQIAKAKEAIENTASNLVDQEYQNLIDKGDKLFLNKDYDEALNTYQAALAIKENDSYAKDRSDEIRQILDNLLKLKRENESQKEQFNQFIAEADQLFNSENFLEAKAVYEKALAINVNDAYTNKQIKLSIEKAKAKAAANKDKRYNQAIASADKLFNQKEYDKAIEVYKRALGLRKYEQYPKTKMAEIEAIKNANAKAQGSVEYLGEQSNISILEGAALLQQGEIDRERLKQGIVSKQLTQYEGEAANRSLSDFDERLAYENEVTSLKDLRAKSNIGEQEMKSKIASDVDGQMYDFEQKSSQMNRFKDGELLRTNQELVFIDDGFDREQADYKVKHKDAIEQIKEIENERDVRDIAESAHHEVKVTSTNEELENIEFGFNPTTDVQEEYNKVVEMQDASILAEIKVAESTQEKNVIQQQLKEDIIVYEAKLQRKLADEAGTVHEQQMKLDEQVTGAEKQFTESQLGKDDERLRTVEKVKEIDQDQSNQLVERGEAQNSKALKNTQEVETVLDLRSEQARKNEKDLTVIDEDVKNRGEAYERSERQLSAEERKNQVRTEAELLRIENKEAILRSENVESVKENYDELKNQEISRENAELAITDQIDKKKQITQKYVDDLEGNKIKFNETIANTIGDDYPEGVTQESYVRKDSRGIPVKIVTRRIVVKDGRGEVYIRTQTKVGLTYSKNGAPVTEQTWINETESAKLQKHY